ncbi:MAG: hypothetical protein WBL61_05950 [Bryobacteraceae bacterium]
MGSVSSINPGVANLLQTLSNDNSPVMSSPAVISALKKAPTNDIVQLSMQATQLDSVDALFGLSNSSSTGTGSSLNPANLLNGSSGAASTAPQTDANSLLSSAALSGTSPSDQLVYYQTASQAAQTQGLLDAGAISSPSGSLLDVTG